MGSDRLKDVVVVPAWKLVEVDVPAIHPGPTLFHCHEYCHMDMGFMAMMQLRALTYGHGHYCCIAFKYSASAAMRS